ncbi:uncharacterized protein EV422DRAFT_519807 [Fimicolochytrium jonesii]|uniref:uncharacterized protein n=1 Tax=Fimicolochytrium jonesii TaxID=1396493 RepID=UPI0022FE604B|nr:uncharacterized protein EV422DRAFT_519807 [Fimicolochytrium jonesii]KAI8824338.1 hypothetical protein EV422DRAFT_519807 [Fimicolochytrium jonesii]
MAEPEGNERAVQHNQLDSGDANPEIPMSVGEHSAFAGQQNADEQRAAYQSLQPKVDAAQSAAFLRAAQAALQSLLASHQFQGQLSLPNTAQLTQSIAESRTAEQSSAEAEAVASAAVAVNAAVNAANAENAANAANAANVASAAAANSQNIAQSLPPAPQQPAMPDLQQMMAPAFPNHRDETAQLLAHFANNPAAAANSLMLLSSAAAAAGNQSSQQKALENSVAMQQNSSVLTAQLAALYPQLAAATTTMDPFASLLTRALQPMAPGVPQFPYSLSPQALQEAVLAAAAAAAVATGDSSRVADGSVRSSQGSVSPTSGKHSDFSLRADQVVPGKDGRYPCTHCERSFSRHYNLKSHLRTHENHRPFECTVCDLRFTRNHDLNRHMKTHSRERPHVCSGCGRKFARRDALRRHERMDSEGKRAHCVPGNHNNHPAESGSTPGPSLAHPMSPHASGSRQEPLSPHSYQQHLQGHVPNQDPASGGAPSTAAAAAAAAAVAQMLPGPIQEALYAALVGAAQAAAAATSGTNVQNMGMHPDGASSAVPAQLPGVPAPPTLTNTPTPAQVQAGVQAFLTAAHAQAQAHLQQQAAHSVANQGGPGNMGMPQMTIENASAELQHVHSHQQEHQQDSPS